MYMRIPSKMPRHRKALNKCYLSPSAPSCFSSLRYSGYNLVPDNWELEAMARIGSKHTKRRADWLWPSDYQEFFPSPFYVPLLAYISPSVSLSPCYSLRTLHFLICSRLPCHTRLFVDILTYIQDMLIFNYDHF